MSNEQVRPFSNGTEFMFWLDHSCAVCVKSSGGHGTCEIEDALYDGMLTGGVTQAIFDRMRDPADPDGDIFCREVQYTGIPDATPEIPGLLPDTPAGGANDETV